MLSMLVKIMMLRVSEQERNEKNLRFFSFSLKNAAVNKAHFHQVRPLCRTLDGHK